MIIVKLSGGLGNQMFQYAFGRSLGVRMGEQVYYDISSYGQWQRSTRRSFELDIFSALSSTVVIKEPPFELRRGMRKIHSLKTCFGITHWDLVVDRLSGFQEDILKGPFKRNVYFDGYWQSEKYFQDNTALIRQELSFPQSVENSNQVVLNQMAADCLNGILTVSVHVRRSDYCDNARTRNSHGVLPVEYYYNASKFMASRLGRVSYYVFSDDLPWCQKNLKFKEKTTFVDVNVGKTAWMDMRLMSGCRHHIIANSSFSWWAAWLNPDPAKVVIAPEKWFSNKIDTKDLLPVGWLSL